MNVIHHHVNSTVDFASLKVGDPFLFSGNVYIKVHLSRTEDAAHNRFNAIRLHDGYSGMFKLDTRVNPAPKAAVVLEHNYEN